jgi:hypothetical protein
VSSFEPIDRRQTHFVGRVEEDGTDAFEKSCDHFLSQLDGLLLSPWDSLSVADQAFVAGYLCHLAADEPWKEFGWRLLREFKIVNWQDFPIPGGVILTAFSVLSSDLFMDFPAVAKALEGAAVPRVMAHIPHASLRRMWDAAREYLLDGRTAESYLKMLERSGSPKSKVDEIRLRHEYWWNEAMAFVQDTGGIEPYVDVAVERAVEVIPRLWGRNLQRSPIGEGGSGPNG